jgi:MFS family permease
MSGRMLKAVDAAEADRPVVARSRRPGPEVLAAAGAGVATWLLLVARNPYLFGTRIQEEGDYAANSILVDRAEHLRLLVGNYSRVGFHHPGPALLYVEAAGKALFQDLLHLVPTAYNGEMLGVFALNALLVGLTVRVVLRHQRSLAVAVAALAAVLAWTAGTVPLGNLWFPYMYFMPFLLLGVAGASVAVGSTADLPLLVLAGGLLVHGHIAFTMFVGVSGVVALGAWAWSVRGRSRGSPGVRRELAGHRGAVLWALGLVGLFALPMVLDLALHWPGEWRAYADYVSRNRAGTNSLRSALDYAGHFWPRPVAGAAGMAIAGVGAAALAATDPDARRRRFVLALLGVVVLLSLLFLVYAVRGVDHLDQTYIGVFYRAVPLMLLVAAVVAAGRLVERLGRPAVWAAGGVACAVALAAAVTGPALGNPYRGDPELPAMVAALRAAPARAGRPVALRFPHHLWPQTVGLVIAAHRDGLRACVDDPTWTLLFSADYVCGGRERAAGWQVALAPLRGRHPPGTVVWAGQHVVAVALAPASGGG